MDISFYCYKCGQHIVIDGAGAGVSVQCPKCQAELVVPSAQAEQSPVRQGERPPSSPRKPKRRLGLVLGIVGVVLVFLAILRVVLIAGRATAPIASRATAPTQDTLAVAETRANPVPPPVWPWPPTQDTLAVAETRVDVVKQLEAIIKRFSALSPASADFDFDSVRYDVNPSSSGSLVSPYIGEVDYVMPAQVTSWCWNSPSSDSNPRTVNCRVHVCAWFAYQNAEWVFKELKPDEHRAWSECNGCPSFSLTKKSQELMEQQRQRWQTATAR